MAFLTDLGNKSTPRLCQPISPETNEELIADFFVHVILGSGRHLQRHRDRERNFLVRTEATA